MIDRHQTDDSAARKGSATAPIAGLIAVALLGLLQGCATLDKSECREANWKVIGLEDGSAGRPISYIGEHRESCAEHGVKPDLGKYRRGHAEGVRIYCTPHKAFQLGKAGKAHAGVCPNDLRAAFLNAYDDGVELRALQTAIADTRNRIKSTRLELDGINRQISRLEPKLVNAEGTALDRQNWVEDLKRLQSRKKRKRAELRDLENEAADRQHEFDHLNAQFHY